MVTLEGSRTNTNIPPDDFQDFDITFFVTDMDSFTSCLLYTSMSLFEEPHLEPQPEPEKPKKKKLLSIGIGAAPVSYTHLSGMYSPSARPSMGQTTPMILPA